jgi:beta-apo-4'-carotenal oxygenase
MAEAKVFLPVFEHDQLDSIADKSATLRSTFRTGRTKDIQYRLTQLRKLYWGLVDNAEFLHAALAKDMRKSRFESILCEFDFLTYDILYTIRNLEKWAKDKSWTDVPVQFMMMKFRIRSDPLGVALIIGAYNFPVILTLQPLVGAIAAGCTAAVKPSENCPATAAVMKKIVAESLDNDAYTVVNGAVPETTVLLDQKWDKICYTGGQQVGKIIAKKAAETFTPVLLEMGGLNPAFITKNADLNLAAKRLLWGKCMNAGQVCVSQNYMMVERSVAPQFIEALTKAYNMFFPNGPKASPDFSRIINKRQFLRMKKMLDETRGKIVLGGEIDEEELYISPTVVLVDSPLDSMMVEESFGPIMSLMPFDSLEEAINIANGLDSTPLALMTFGNEKESSKGKPRDLANSKPQPQQPDH